MYFIYWRHNPRFMWRQMGHMIPYYTPAEVEAIQISRTKRVGSVAIIKSNRMLNDTMWTFTLIKPAKIVLFKQCKEYCEDYKQIKQNGKKRFVKHDTRQTELKFA